MYTCITHTHILICLLYIYIYICMYISIYIYIYNDNNDMLCVQFWVARLELMHVAIVHS